MDTTTKKLACLDISKRLQQAIQDNASGERTYRDMANSIEGRYVEFADALLADAIPSEPDPYGYTPCPECGMDSIGGELCGWCDGSLTD